MQNHTEDSRMDLGGGAKQHSSASLKQGVYPTEAIGCLTVVLPLTTTGRVGTF